MRSYKVSYLREDYSIQYKYIAASSVEQAREKVYNDTLDCIQTLKAELVFSGPMRMGDHHYYDLNGDMANEFNDTHY